MESQWAPVVMGCRSSGRQRAQRTCGLLSSCLLLTDKRVLAHGRRLVPPIRQLDRRVGKCVGAAGLHPRSDVVRRAVTFLVEWMILEAASLGLARTRVMVDWSGIIVPHLLNKMSRTIFFLRSR